MRHALLVALTALAAGCGAPVLQMHHGPVADLPLPATVETIGVRPLAVTGADAASCTAAVRAALAQRLAEGGLPYRAAAGDHADAWLGGSVAVTARDTPGTRTVRQMDPATGTLGPVTLETLVRTVEVETALVLSDATSAKRLVAAAATESYDSRHDPRVRGELGLDRPADPARIPPLEAILDDLLGRCVGTFVAMLEPVPVTGEVAMRPVDDPLGQRGLGAAASGDLRAAVAYFRRALERDPGHRAVRFNLAAALEASGSLAAARQEYRLLAETADDAEAQAGVVRLTRVLGAPLRQEPPSPAP